MRAGGLQRAVSFFRISPERTNAQEEEDKQMKMESCGGSLHDDFLSRDEEEGWQMCQHVRGSGEEDGGG